MAAEQSASRQRVAFALLGTVQVVLIATITVITVALPAIQVELRLSEAELVYAVAAYGLSFGGLLLLGGRLADLLGHRRVLGAGLLVFGIASALAAVAPGLPLLVTARFGQGAGAAAAAPAAMALLGSVFPEAGRRGRALALWGVLASVGAGAGNVLSGVALHWVSWRWTFVAPAVLAVGVALAAPRLLPPGPAPRPERLDLTGAALVTAGLAALIHGLTELHSLWTAGGVLLLGVFALTQLRGAAPLLPPTLLASPRRLAALLAIGLTAGCMAAFFFLLALHFQRVLGYSALATSAAFLPPALAVLPAGPLAARALVRLHPALVTSAGLGLAALGLAVLGAAGGGGSYLGPLLLGAVLFPAGAGITFSGATVWAVGDAPAHRAGLVGGVVNTAMELGPPLGLAVLVPLAAARTGPGPAGTVGGFGAAFLPAAAALAVAALLVLSVRLLPRPRARAAD